MRFPFPAGRAAIGGFLLVSLLVSPLAQATVGPPVKITMPADAPPAVAGRPYSGVFEVRVGRAGVIGDFKLKGEGWKLQSFNKSLEGTMVQAGVVKIPFTATPSDVEEPIQLSMRYQGRLVSRSFRLGPEAFARRGKGRPAVQAVAGSAGGAQPEASTLTLRFTGRIVYSRPTELNDDDEPIWFNPTDEGVDTIWVEIMDDDGAIDDTIWSGYTDKDGYFDTGVFTWEDCDPLPCETEPDIYLRWECDTPVVNVQDAEDILEEDFNWDTEDVLIYEDFTGNFIDFGTWKPGSVEEMAPLHIHNSIVRAHRFLMDSQKIGVVIGGLPEVDVLWPDGDNAFYNPFFEEIHISRRREWNEGTHTHEYGHHLLENTAENIEPDYCNGFCDNDPDPPFPDCGHCVWCQETDHDAWNEGFPNWLADIVTREYPFTYTFSDGSPYEALIARSQENLGICDQDGQSHPPFITEGFLGALLRDIEDSTDFDGKSLQDDHDGDGICDCLELGYREIFTVALIDDVTTPAAFLNAFRARYPQHTPGLHSTAFNVHPDYVSQFPADTQPPGVPPWVTSPSHPPVVGGTSPCIELHVGPVPDDVTGACGFSYVWTTTPAGLEPDMDEEGFYVDGSCCIVTHALNLGDHWISLRAKDCAGHWSNEWETYGPFTVTECNGNGILDICELPCVDVCPCNEPDVCGNACDASLLADDPQRSPRLKCRPSPSFCPTLYPGGACGQGADCNLNLKPDDCDIADGTSADCNEDGIPDECQNMATWVGGSGSWHDPQNWDTGQIPQTGQYVCINDPNEDITVTYTAGTTDIWHLACHESLDFRTTSTNHQLSIQTSSFIRGDLLIGGRTGNQITHANLLTIDGQLSVTGPYWLRGSGDIIVKGGMSITGNATLFDGKDVYLADNSDAVATGYFIVNTASDVRITPGSTYTYQGDFNVISGGSGRLFNEGLFQRTAGTGRATIGASIQNDGLIHNQIGELSMASGGTHTGMVLSDPGTLLSLVNGTYEWMPGSGLTADDVTLSAGNSTTIRGNVNIAGTLTVGTPSGSNLTFTNEANVTSYGQNLFARAGTVRFESPAAPAVDFDTATVGEGFIYCGNPYFDTGETFVMNSLLFVCGTINGADPITINDSFTWGGGGSFLSGGAVTCLGPVIIQSTSSQRNLSRLFYNTAHATFLGSFTPSGAGRFINTTTGTVDLQGNVGLTGGQSTNDGTITKTAGTGRSTLAGMTNNGLIHAQTGEIFFYFGGQNNGDILGDPGTLLSFNNAHEMLPGSSLTGDNVDFTGNASTIRGDVNITGTLSLGNSSSGGSATFTSEANVTSYGHTALVRSGTVRFEAPVTGPSLDFDTVTIGEGNTNGQTYFDTGQPINIDTLNLMRGNIQGADPITIHDAFTWGPVGTIFSGGTITCRAPWTLQASSSSRSIARDFVNHGDGSLFGPVNLSSSADFTNEPDGTVDFKSDAGGFGLTLTSHVQNNGVIVKSGGAGDSPISTHFTNAGTLEILTGRVNFQANYTLNFIQTAGATILNGGDLATLGNPYHIQGGDLAGIGTVFGDVNNSGGRVTPGLSIGTLTCDGNYTHGADATLKIELGGLNPGTEHDQLVVTGTADLQGGTLNVVPAGGFMPQVGQQFVILTADDVQNTFAEVTGPGEYTVSYNATNVTITVDVSPCSAFVAADFDLDCDVDGDDVALFVSCASGPAIPLTPGCEAKDLDLDGDVDARDFGIVQRCFSGPDVVADANCEN